MFTSAFRILETEQLKLHSDCAKSQSKIENRLGS